MGAFSVSLSGLLASQEQLSVISNNLANLNTPGFKGSDANFSDLIYQMLGSDGAGDPIQTGLGTQVGSTNLNFTQGTINDTGVNTNVAIDGNGFLQVQNNGVTLYSRDGNLTVNANGYLVAPDGSEVLGYSAVNGGVNTSSAPSPIKLELNLTSPPQATSTVELAMNLDASASVGTTFSTDATVYDSLGNAHVLGFQFVDNGNNNWSYTVTLPGSDVTGVTASAVTLGSGSLQFTNNGTLTASTTDEALALPSGDTLADGAASLKITWDVLDPATQAGVITQVAGASAVSSTQQNGLGGGTLQSFSIQNDGTIQGTFSNGQVANLAQIVLATFTNEQGLLQVGNDNYMATLASGLPNVGVPGTGGRGTLVGGALESSNVNLSTEFSNLILAQTDYQANSHAFNVLDEVAQTGLTLGTPV